MRAGPMSGRAGRLIEMIERGWSEGPGQAIGVASATTEQLGVFHDILHSLTTIAVLTEAIGLEQGLTIDGRRRLELVRSEIKLTQELARVMLHRAEPGLEVIALDEVVESTAAVFAETASAHVTLKIRRVLVLAARSDLKRLVANLLQNAFAAADDRGEVRIEVDATREFAVLRVTDSGPGFGRLHREGTRWGLSVVRSVVARLDGQLELGAGPAGGAEVLVKLPRAGQRAPAEGAGWP